MKKDWPLDLRLLMGTLEEREQEAERQGVTETWETRARRDEEMRRTRYRKDRYE